MIIELIETKEEQVVLKIGEDIVAMDKQGFQDNFVEVSPGIYDATPEYEAMIKERCDDIERILPDLMLAKNNNPMGIMGLASKMQDYCTKWDVSMKVALQEVGEIYKRFLERSLDMGVAFNDEVYDLPPELKSKNKKNAKAFDKERKPKPIKKGPTIGELNPGLAALKDKLKTVH